MMERLILAVDIGTSSTKGLLYDKKRGILARASRNYPTHYPEKGQVEQPPIQWWEAAAAIMKQLLEDEAPEQVACVCVTGHMSSLVFLDKALQPLRQSMMISDTRAAAITEKLRHDNGNEIISITGNAPIEAFSLPKILWLQEQEPEVLQKAEHILFPKDYIRAKLTGIMATDPTDAGNSLLMNRRTSNWDVEWLQRWNIGELPFPTMKEPTETAGVVTKEAAESTGLLPGTPVAVGAADIASSQIGSGAVEEGTIQLTLSSSAQIVVKLPEILPEAFGKITHHRSAIPHEWYGMGTIFSGGSGADWVFNTLYHKEGEDLKAGGWREVEKKMASSAAIEESLLFLPHLTGSGSPHFNPSDQGAFVGLKAAHTKLDLLRAALEGISFHLYETIKLYEAWGLEKNRITIGAGGSRNNFWCQMLADIIGHPVERLTVKDASTFGAIIIGAVAAGWYNDLQTASQDLVHTEKTFYPDNNANTYYEKKFLRFKELHRILSSFFRE
ncbi:xylulokinase [Salibacterium aidingense]|uniref:xylulokinase n=1 Tax=Salibacterium aidingense TaxID=384933 RepID=UPI003BCDD120